jgi:hypothetical protein
MSPMDNNENIIKLFGVTNQIAELDLNRIEQKYSIDLGRNKKVVRKDNVYYPQFDLEVRNEAKQMAKSYEIFYCLEKTIRKMVSDTMKDTHGDDWWNTKVPQHIRDEVKKRIKQESDAGVTIRSDEEIDYTTFGELGIIIKSNAVAFGDIFTNPNGIDRVMSNLNTLRAPIAHCSKLAEDEELRLQLSVRDWFRLME